MKGLETSGEGLKREAASHAWVKALSCCGFHQVLKCCHAWACLGLHAGRDNKAAI